MSRAKSIKRRLWHDQDNGYEYEADQNPAKDTWHEIDPRADSYREIDPNTGTPVAGGEGQWRKLK